MFFDATAGIVGRELGEEMVDAFGLWAFDWVGDLRNIQQEKLEAFEVEGGLVCCFKEGF